ncbi:MAG TPA: MerR family transcriptional regulator, partial [Streptosporangiaceae bacterium]|nr:MerR family transcriptional regulator [Streptosporangiaceae bacterium]
MEPGSGAAWTAGQVARHLGIAESTLRSWHRRYGIGPQGREPGRYRRYTEADVARLQRMLDLIKQGMLASDAARTVEAGEPEAVSAERDVADLVAAAQGADPERCGIVLDSVMVRRGVLEAWESVCRPALAIVDAAQRDDPDCMDIEHALSW